MNYAACKTLAKVGFLFRNNKSFSFFSISTVYRYLDKIENKNIKSK